MRKEYWVTEQEATYNFYHQLLTGNKVDNIQGIPGMREKTADKLLANQKTEIELYTVVIEQYWRTVAKRYKQDMSHKNTQWEHPSIKKEADKQLCENAQLLWRRRKPDGMWEPPI